jgi:hypothetical protein
MLISKWNGRWTLTNIFRFVAEYPIQLNDARVIENFLSSQYSELKSRSLAGLLQVSRGKLGYGTWIRTKVRRVKGFCPTARRFRNILVAVIGFEPISILLVKQTFYQIELNGHIFRFVLTFLPVKSNLLNLFLSSIGLPLGGISRLIFFTISACVGNFFIYFFHFQ